MNSTSLLILAGGGAFVVGVLVIFLAVFTGRKKRMADRVQNFVVEQERRVTVSFTPTQETPARELQGSLFGRTILPAFNKLVSYLARFTPESTTKELNRKLSIAGNPMNMRAREFTGFRMVVFLLGFILAVLYLVRQSVSGRSLLIAALIVVFSYLLPTMWLRSTMEKVQHKIRLGLPDALDMLSVCASAGLGFDQSLQKVSDYWHTPLGAEFRRVVQEMEVGLSRIDALRNMADRLQIAELSSFVAMLVQAETLGMQIADVLHSQAEQMRILRQFRAKELANRLPAKMMIPLALCILPALIAVILGPMLPSFLKTLQNL